MSRLVASTRMYNVTPGVTLAWKRLLDIAARQARVALDVMEYPAPAPLSELWARPDMGAVFMCGWPYRRSDPRPQIVAAPVPAEAGCTGPFYRTDMVVRADSPHATLEDTFGGTIAWTDEGSHSGFNAPRRLLAGLRGDRARLYTQRHGPVITPRASAMSVIDGLADVAPLDSYFHTLLRRHEPQTATRLRVVARTECAPIPVLVAAPEADPKLVVALGLALEGIGSTSAGAELLEELCLEGFARVRDPEIYALTEAWDRAARAAGYPVPG